MKRILVLIRWVRRWIDLQSAIYRRWRLGITQGIDIPDTTYIGPGCTITGAGQKIEIGENTTLVANIRLDGPISIGNNVILAANSTLIARNHEFQKGDALPYGTAYIYKPIIVEDNVWIGSNVSIIPGVHIGEGAVIGLGSVVTQDVPPCACVGGNPAKVISWRDKDHYQRLVNEKKFLNNIRGSFIGKKRNIGKHKKEFEKCISEKGFVLSSDITEESSLRSFILYHLHLETPGTKFGNAGKEHIVIKLQEHSDIKRITAEILKSSGEPYIPVLESQVRRDLTDLLELNE